ncbi:MAG: MFS transporter [Gammaproteobacteria bacterium]|nr:MFS transporter [Gammaproteobacteria bacterium]
MTRNNRKIWSWAFYDWANSAFATTVIAGFFPIFFKEYWSAGLPATESTFRLGVANSLSSLLVLAMAPVLGAIADQGTYKKRLLLFFAVVGILFTASLAAIGQGEWPLAASAYVLAAIGFAGANVFYDALIVNVAPPSRYEWASSLGFGLGYLGGGILFGGCVLMTLQPDWFGLQSVDQAVKLSFLVTAVWWALFTIPLARNVTERRRRTDVGWAKAVPAGWRQLRATLGRIRQYRQVVTFLVAYWLYIDAVDTIVRMAVDYGLALGFDSRDLITALLLVQFVGFPSALAFGVLGQRIGPKRGILIGLAVYAVITVWAFNMDETWEFYGMAVAIGLVQGGVQALSRSLYARLIPRKASAEFFGFYNLLGKFAAVLGPVLVGWVAVLSGSNRASILVLLVLFAAGAVLLIRVNVDKADRTVPDTV